MEPRPGVLTVAEAAKFLRISESKCLDGLRRGLIPGRKVVGQWRCLRSQLHEFLREQPHTKQFLPEQPSGWDETEKENAYDLGVTAKSSETKSGRRASSPPAVMASR
jgi:excisionase family DNA binding protein